jgi:hypothetical protein
MTYLRCAVWLGACCAAILCASCAKSAETGADEHVTALGTAEVTAELVEIPGEFIDRPMYDYAFIMKYKVLQVHRGAIDGDTIYVGHYNPLKPRAEAADARVPEVGGNVVKFRVGDVHRMALDVPIDDCFMGGIVNRYFEQGVSPIYWALWTNRATKP